MQMGSGPSIGAVIANAVPSNTIKVPSMTFAFALIRISITASCGCSTRFYAKTAAWNRPKLRVHVLHFPRLSCSKLAENSDI